MNTVTVKRQCNHPLHMVLSLVTFGMWVPVWIVCAIVGRTETHVQQPAQAEWWVQKDPRGLSAVPQRQWNPYKGEWQ